MQDLSSISDLSNLGIATQQPSDKNDELGQEDFLRLMITQFKNQDPFKPMENGDFLGQIAQFGTVSGIQELQSSFSALSESLYSDQALQASALVGRTVLARLDSGALTPGGAISGAVDVPAGTPSLKIEIVDASGQVVKHMDLGSQSAGLVSFQWDGVTDDGELADPGLYNINATVTSDGGTFAAETLIAAPVESVTLARAGSGLTLNLAGMGQLPLSQVRQIM
ncbi:MAG: flagellar hook assembly protein FlgD [Gammaproteobacteria bacterium]|nr:flagellar hook assembly protein FlgD [Gammaproteobacteria bacterium]